MRILAIDYGQKKIGLALATSRLAEPYQVIRYKTKKELMTKLLEIIKEERIEKIVIGLSEGKMGEETKEFGEAIKQESQLPIEYQDETLSTQKAQELSRDAGIKRVRRKEMEDAFSATLILQAYLDAQ